VSAAAELPSAESDDFSSLSMHGRRSRSSFPDVVGAAVTAPLLSHLGIHCSTYIDTAVHQVNNLIPLVCNLQFCIDLNSRFASVIFLNG
jgi:hypothetical protein